MMNNLGVPVHESAPEEDFLGKHEYQAYSIEKFFLEGTGNQIRLYHTRITPKNPPTATICIIHGFGEHSGRFRQVAEYFVALGYEALLIDMRGFGYSGGPRGCAEVEALQHDVITLIKRANTELPLFLYGHSLGGLVCISTIMDHPFLNISGVIATSPLLGFPKDRRLPWFKYQLIRLVGEKLEDFVINSMVNPTALTKSNKQIQSIFGDRLMIPFLSIKMARSILVNCGRINDNAHRMLTPLLIIHGKKDSVTNYHDSEKFIANAGSANKLLHLFPNGYHELQHDDECDQMLRIAKDWLSNVSSRPLAHVNCSKKRLQPKRKFTLVDLFIIILYAALVLLLSKNPKYKGSITRVLFSPVLFMLRK